MGLAHRLAAQTTCLPENACQLCGGIDVAQAAVEGEQQLRMY